MDKRLLVTGCGRSGTKYTAELLKKLGLDVPHEHMGVDGIATWCMAVACDYSPWGGGSRDVRFGTVIHLVLQSTKVTPALTTITTTSWECIVIVIPCPVDEPILLRATKHRYYCNLEAEKVASWRYRLETLPNVFQEFCTRV